MKTDVDQEKCIVSHEKTSVSPPRILVIIPCFNEAATIGRLVSQAKRYATTVVVVDDGSTDRTAEYAQHAGAVVLSHSKNQGKGAALKTGFTYALHHQFDYIVTIDGDGQHNPTEIPNVLQKVIQDSYDLSIGYRVGANTEMPFWRRIGKRILDYTTSLGTGGFVTDSQCGFRAFNNKALASITPKLKGNAFSVESEQLIRAYESDLKIGNTHVTCKYSGLDTSTKNPASHGLSVLSYIVFVVVRQRFFVYLGVLCAFSIVVVLFSGI